MDFNDNFFSINYLLIIKVPYGSTLPMVNAFTDFLLLQDQFLDINIRIWNVISFFSFTYNFHL